MKSKILLVAPLLTILGLGSARNAAAQSAPPSSQTADQKFAAGLDHLALRLVPTQAAFDASVARFERQRRWGIGLLAGGAVLAGSGAGVLG